jgi:hypothetical protein
MSENENPLAKPEEFESPIDSMRMGGDDIPNDIPILKIWYNMKDAPEGFEKGKLTLAGATQYDELSVILLGARYVGNILWPKFDPNNENPQPTCKSSNGLNPDGGDEPFQMSCAECLRHDWEWKNMHNEPPPCKKTTACLYYLRDDKFPAIMTVQRRARSTQFRGLRSALERKVLQVRELISAVPGCQVSWCFGLTLKAIEYGTYYLPQWTIEEQLTEDQVREAAEIFEHAKPLFDTAGIQEIADGDRLGKDEPAAGDDDDLPF